MPLPKCEKCGKVGMHNLSSIGNDIAHLYLCHEHHLEMIEMIRKWLRGFKVERREIYSKDES